MITQISHRIYRVVVEKDGEDQLDRSCEKWRSELKTVLQVDVSSSSCSWRFRHVSLFLDPQDEVGPSISSLVVLCFFVRLVCILVLVFVVCLCPSFVHVLATFPGTVLFPVLCSVHNFIFIYSNTDGLMMVDWWSRTTQLIWICYNKRRVSITSLYCVFPITLVALTAVDSYPLPPAPRSTKDTRHTQHDRQFLPATKHNLQIAWMISLTLSTTHTKFCWDILIWVHFGSS